MNHEKISTGYVSDLSKGAVVAVKFADNGNDVAWGVDPSSGRVSWVYGRWTIGKTIFLTADEALADGEAKRVKKIASLKKQLVKLEKMQFKLA